MWHIMDNMVDYICIISTLKIKTCTTIYEGPETLTNSLK